MENMKTKKELKSDYKQMKPQMGVFQIKNIVNGKILLEGSLDINSRWNKHQAELKFSSHRNKELQKDWNQFGKDNFIFEILSELDYQESDNVNYFKEIELLENMFLEELQPFETKGYNLRK